MDKQLIRTGVAKAVSALSSHAIEQQSVATSQLVLKQPAVVNARTIAVFMNMDHEIRTLPLIKELLKQGKHVYLPNCTRIEPPHERRWPKQRTMLKFFKMDSYNDVLALKPQGKYQLREPTGGDDIMDHPHGFDIVLVPAVGFTPGCFRIGYGGGFYDDYIKRHFERFGTRPYLLGIGLQEQLVPAVPLEPHDEQLDAVILNDNMYIKTT